MQLKINHVLSERVINNFASFVKHSFLRYPPASYHSLHILMAHPPCLFQPRLKMKIQRPFISQILDKRKYVHRYFHDQLLISFPLQLWQLFTWLFKKPYEISIICWTDKIITQLGRLSP